MVLDARPWIRRNLAEFAQGLGGRKILEIGSGRQDQGHDAYSFRELFDSSNEFVQSDVVPEYGHELVDVRAIGREDLYGKTFEIIGDHAHPRIEWASLYNGLQPDVRQFQ